MTTDIRCCCEAAIVAIGEAIELSYERGLQPKARPRTACVACGAIDGGRYVRFDEHTAFKMRAMLVASQAQKGSADKLHLPHLSVIAPRAKIFVLATDAEGRIEVDLDAVRANQKLRDELRQRLEKKMAVKLAYPRAVKQAFGLGHPAILHIGLTYKFVDDQHLDASHVRFAPYIPHVLRNPIEVWRDSDGDPPREVFRVIGALAVAKEIHFMQIIVEGDSHIVTTAYVMDYPNRIEQYRQSVPAALRWATV